MAAFAPKVADQKDGEGNKIPTPPKPSPKGRVKPPFFWRGGYGGEEDASKISKI